MADDHDDDWIAARYVLSSILGRNPFVVDRDDDDDDDESFPIDALPPHAAYAESTRLPKSMPVVRATEGGTVCTVCTDEIAVADAVVRLPCAHWFHAACIAPWLGIRSTCPLCRADLMLLSKDDDGVEGVDGCDDKPYFALAAVGSTSVSAVLRRDHAAAGSLPLFG